jgi:hypothetical protein
VTSIARRFILPPIGLLTAAMIDGCAPKVPPPPPSAAPASTVAPTIMLTCPDPTVGPSIVINAIEDAHRALSANPSTPLPPPCVLTAFGNIARPLPDSINEHALAIASALSSRGGDRRELLASEVVLFARARRDADVSRVYDQLLALNPQPSLEVSRLAMGAARQRGDTAALIRALTKAVANPAATPAYGTELNVLRQVGALKSAIDQGRGFIRQNPRYVAAYPSLVSNFGTLAMTDSVVSYVRRALAQNTPRTQVSASLDPYVSAMLRHANLYGTRTNWDAAIAAATRVDSALSTSSTNFLVAALIVHSAAARIAEISAFVSGDSWTPEASPDERARNRVAGCQRIPSVMASLNAAEQRMRNGGDRFQAGGVSQTNAGLATAKERIAGLQEVCAR